MVKTHRAWRNKMKKVIIGMIGVLAALVSSTSMAAMSYECWSYVSSSPDKMVHVSANNSSDAIKLAKKKMDKLNIRFDYVKCK